MNSLKYQESKFEELAKFIETSPRHVDVTESVEGFKKKKAIAMISDYIDLYPKLFAMGFRNSAILEELIGRHGITLMSFRNFIAKEGVPLTRLKQLAAWSYRKKLTTIADYNRRIQELSVKSKIDGNRSRWDAEIDRLKTEIVEYKKIHKLN